MTTDGAVILRERAAEWPLFAAAELPDEIGVLTIQVKRPGLEAQDIAVARASRLFGAGLVDSGLADRFGLWLLASASTFPRGRRLSVVLARRAGVWRRFEQDGVAIPAGPRSEVEIDYPEIDALGFGGGVRFPPAELQRGVEVTRTHNAVCVGVDPGVDPVTALFSTSMRVVDGRPPTLLPRAVRLVADGVWAVAARGFIGFDHLSAGVDVFADVRLLDGLETALVEGPHSLPTLR